MFDDCVFYTCLISPAFITSHRAGVFTKSLLHHGYVHCLAAGDDEGARSYLVQELKAVQDSEGEGSPNAIEIELVLNGSDKVQ